MPVVILDRDGVINRDSPEFIKSPAEWVALPGSLEAIASLCSNGFQVAVASNQSGVGRGLFDLGTLDAINDRMREAVENSGGRLAVVECCPHHPDDACDCRKPRTGLLRRVASMLAADLHGVPCIGDSARDLEAASAVGARPILVLTGNGRRTLAAGIDAGVEVFRDLAEAAAVLIQEGRE